MFKVQSPSPLEGNKALASALELVKRAVCVNFDYNGYKKSNEKNRNLKSYTPINNVYNKNKKLS